MGPFLATIDFKLAPLLPTGSFTIKLTKILSSLHGMWPILQVLYCLLDGGSAQIQYGGGDRAVSNIETGRMIPQVLPPCPNLWQWGCKNGECIAQYDVCDGVAQCSDGSDEWNCNDLQRLRQNPGKVREMAANGPAPPAAAATSLPASTTPPTAPPGYIVMNRRQVIFVFIVFALLAALLVLFIRRRARQKAFSRNRRTGLLQQDSDEDDILISSMYS